jgi:hypothetical protein
MNLKLREGRYWTHGTVAGRFLRLPLGTANKDAASTAVNRIERALAQGEVSSLWPELKRSLPPRTFAALASIANYREPEAPRLAARVPSWQDLGTAFSMKMHQRILLGKMAESTRERYQQTMRAFNLYLKETGVNDSSPTLRADARLGEASQCP